VSNPYCEALGIQVPRLEDAAGSRDANWYSLLIAALLERGGPVTLEETAERFEQAGIAFADRALAALQRCRPARPPIYRDGNRYALDPHDDEADLWAFRLGLRPPKAAAWRNAQPEPMPEPESPSSPAEPLSVAELDSAWRDEVPFSWSAQRTAICVLDAHGRAMTPDEVLDFISARSRWSRLSADSARYWRAGAPIRTRAEGKWELDRSHDSVRSARRAVRERSAMYRRYERMQPDPAVAQAYIERAKRERQAHADRLAGMRRVLVYAFPVRQPRAVVLLDVNRREITTLMGDDLTGLGGRLADYDIIAALDVRALLRNLAFDHGSRRLAELGPPQKTRRLNRRGRTLKITTDLLVRGSCGISRPFGDRRLLELYQREGQYVRFRRRLESDAKSLYALYQYGRLHGAVRLRWGFLDEMIPAPWVHRDEETLGTLMICAFEQGIPLEVVTGSAPGWKDPWARARKVAVEKGDLSWRSWLVDDGGYPVYEEDVQLARLAEADDR
jgi:hypothetical protein